MSLRPSGLIVSAGGDGAVYVVIDGDSTSDSVLIVPGSWNHRRVVPRCELSALGELHAAPSSSSGESGGDGKARYEVCIGNAVADLVIGMPGLMTIEFVSDRHMAVLVFTTADGCDPIGDEARRDHLGFVVAEVERMTGRPVGSAQVLPAPAPPSASDGGREDRIEQIALSIEAAAGVLSLPHDAGKLEGIVTDLVDQASALRQLPAPASDGEELRELAHDAVMATVGLLPLVGSETTGYRLTDRVHATITALPEEWASAAQAIAELHAAVRELPTRETGREQPCTKVDPCDRPCFGTISGCPYTRRAADGSDFEVSYEPVGESAEPGEGDGGR